MLSLVLVSFAFAGSPTTFAVPGDSATIQGAIELAADGDTVLVAPGTYVEQLDLLGKAITVRSSAGPKQTIIDSQGQEVWFDSPYAPVVRMVNGEGPGTELVGFTITGANDPSGFGGGGVSGVYAAGATPTLRNCRIENIVGGPGVYTDGAIENCRITGNSSLPYGDGGGVSGAPTITDSVVSDNRSGGKGGGVYLTGPALITGSTIQGNVAGNGADGYSGGGVYGPATIERCVITGNGAHHYFSGGPPDEVGAGVDGAVSIHRSTIADNFVINSAGLVVKPGAGVHRVATITSSILWDNEDNEVTASSPVSITNSIVRGGFPGAGNGSGDPLFLDPANGDYSLVPGSAAIDAGDPGAPLDPDGTPQDAGAIFFPQFSAQLTPRNGTGANPVCYTSLANPTIGQVWNAVVDTSVAVNPVFSVLVFYGQPAAGIFVPGGEILVLPGTQLPVTRVAPSVAGSAAHTLNIPTDYTLGGIEVFTQAIVLGDDYRLCNALDLVIGL